MKRVLVVDDEQDIRELFDAYLSSRGYFVKAVNDGLEAIKITDAEKFDFIFLDIKMSGLDGIETFKNIRKKDPACSIVIMTGYRTLAKELISDTPTDQIHSVLYKPFSMKEVMNIVK